MNDQAVGPVTMEDLLSLRSSGVLDDQSLVWRESQGDWQALATVMPQNQRVETPKSSMSARTGPLSYSPGEAAREDEVEPQLRAKNYSSLAGGLPSSQSPFAHGAITAPLARNETFSPANAPAYLGGGGGSGGSGGGAPSSAATAPLGRLEPVREPEPMVLRQQHATVEAQPALGFTQQPGLVVTNAPAPASGLEYGMGLPHICEECRMSFLEEDMLHYENFWVCSSCKPRFVAKLQEGSFRKGRLNFAGVITRTGALYIDALVMQAVLLPIAISAQVLDAGRLLAHPHDPSIPIFGLLATPVNLLLEVLYYFIFVWLVGATPGQAYFGTRVVQADGSPLKAGQSACWALCVVPVACLGHLPVLSALFDPEKRTMQDFVCNTRYIYKRD